MGKRKASTEGTPASLKEIAPEPMPAQPYFIDGSLAGKEVEAGIDEAGRGPVLGPMVYSIGLAVLGNQNGLKELGVDDSKALNEERRSEIFEQMNSLEKKSPSEYLSYSLRVLPPEQISAQMLRRSKVSLNELSFQAAFALIRRAREMDIRIVKLFVDTVGPPEVYRNRLEKQFPGIEIKVSKKADSLFPIVSAASIAAKVTRDRLLQSWTVGMDPPPGSGYPADPATKTFIRSKCDPVFGLPPIARHSWATAQDLMAANSVPLTWDDEDSWSGKPKKHFQGATRHAFFRHRNLNTVSSW